MAEPEKRKMEVLVSPPIAACDGWEKHRWDWMPAPPPELALPEEALRIGRPFLMERHGDEMVAG